MLVQAFFLDESYLINRLRISTEGFLIPHRTGDNKYSVFEKAITEHKNMLQKPYKKPVKVKEVTHEDREKKFKDIVEMAKQKARS